MNGVWPPGAARLLPDWSSVAAEHCGVHLGVGAALTVPEGPIVCAGGVSLLVGWHPGQTVWLARPA